MGGSSESETDSETAMSARARDSSGSEDTSNFSYYGESYSATEKDFTSRSFKKTPVVPDVALPQATSPIDQQSTETDPMIYSSQSQDTTVIRFIRQSKATTFTELR